MYMMNFITVVGARPQFVKAAALSKVIKTSYRESLSEKIVHTGQHYDFKMSESFFSELNIPKPYMNLNINSVQGKDTTGIMITELTALFKKEEPDFVLVYGDTNSTLAASIAAGQLFIPLVHVEGGVRNADPKIPEHFNRVITDHASQLIFCVSEQDLINLQNENLGNISYKTGDIMLDTVKIFQEQLTHNKLYDSFVLLTIHRNFNTDHQEVLRAIIDNVAKIDKLILFPIHPRTQNAITKFNIKIPNNLKLIEPLSYLEILSALNACDYVLTDSGGLQKEAVYFGKKAIFISHFPTFWQDLVDLDMLKTMNPRWDILDYLPWLSEPVKPFINPYGDGKAAYKILDIITQEF